MFESISRKFSQIAGRVWRRKKITEANIEDSLKEIRAALLSADVGISVVNEFLGKVREEAVGQQITKGVTSGQEFIYLVFEKLKELMGDAEPEVVRADKPPTVIVVAGLQGSGKTTTCGKLARYLREKEGRKPLMVAADIHRPAAIDQLQQLGDQLDIPVWREDGATAQKIAVNGVAHARRENLDTVIIDTAGRLHIDEAMMQEVSQITRKVSPHEIFLVCDAMTGQDAVKSAKAFNERLELTGVLLTKLDGDARGGAAISVRAVTGKPIRFAGVGEHMDRLEPFYPERMASRILGMGDIVSLVEKARDQVTEEEQEKLLEKMLRNKFDLNDFLGQLQKVEKMGSIKELMSFIPGMGNMMEDHMPDTEAELISTKAIIGSMTRKERANPEILNTSRRERIARGCGQTLQSVNELLSQFKQMRKMMSKLGQAGRGPLGKLRTLKNLKNMLNPENLSGMMQNMMHQGDPMGGKGPKKPPPDRSKIKDKRKKERQRRKKARKKRK